MLTLRQSVQSSSWCQANGDNFESIFFDVGLNRILIREECEVVCGQQYMMRAQSDIVERFTVWFILAVLFLMIIWEYCPKLPKLKFKNQRCGQFQLSGMISVVLVFSSIITETKEVPYVIEWAS